MPAGAWRWAALVFHFPCDRRRRTGGGDAGCVALGGCDAAGRHRRGGVDLSLCRLAAGIRSTRRTRAASPKPQRARMSPGRSPAADGAVLDCNPCLSPHGGRGSTAKPRRRRNWRSRAEPSTRVLYRLTRDGGRRRGARRVVSSWRPASRSSARCGRCPTARPHGGSRRVSRRAPRTHKRSQAAAAPDARAAEPASAICSATHRWGWRSRTADGKLSDANRAFAEFLRRADVAQRPQPDRACRTEQIAPALSDLLAKATARLGRIRAAANAKTHGRSVRASDEGRPRDRSICSTYPSRRRSKPNSRSRRRCRPSASSRAASRTTSTICSPSSSATANSC